MTADPSREQDRSGAPSGPEAPTASTGPPGVMGTVVASVNGYGPAPVMSGVNVTASKTTCSTSRPLPETCPLVNWTSTNASGGFNMNLPVGTYYIAAVPDPTIVGGAYPDGFGGSSTEVTVNGTTLVRLLVYPFVPYGNVSIVLPGYVCDAQYLNNHGTVGPGCQNPVLSWTQDGAYYLNATNELVFYSFVNRSVYSIAAWSPLYQHFPAYAMIPNELFTTQDGSYIYGWGTLTPSSTTVTAEAVNVTTHRVFLYNFTGVTTTSVAKNGQVQLTGWDGNDSHLTLILTTGALYDHDLWSDSQSLVATLSFYEANNVYWEPYLNGYVNVQADGATGDRVEEWQLNGPTGYSLSQTFTGNWGSGRVINGVNGIALNRTSETLSFALGAASGANTVVAALNQSGTITGFTSVLEERAGVTQLGPASASDRPTLVTSGPDLQAYYDGFYNASWLVEMTPGHLGYETTNLSGAFPYGGNPPQYAWPQWSQEGEYYNTSYLIAPSSYACNSQFHSACTINGSGGVAVGTLWWYWQLGQPRFPNPSTAPMDENSSPGITTVTGANVTASSVALNWTTAAGSDVLSYTLEWGTNRSFGHVVGIGGANTSYTLVGLASDTRYYFALQAWNLHYAGGSAGISSALTNGPPTPTGLSVLSTTNSSVTWNWTEPAGGSILNNTLYVFAGGTCVGTPTAFSTGGPATQEMVGGLAAGTSYSAEVTSWNAFGQSTVSSCVSATTLPDPLPTYEVTFAETGLPAEDAWYLNITGGPALASVGAVTTVNATLSNGTYPYVLTTNDPTWSPSYAHNFTVDGGPLSVDVSFVPVTYPVTFTESGLPLGTPWTVTVGTGANVSNSSTHVVRETNGTYPYALSDISGWHQTTLPYTGSITVHGAAVVEPALVYRPFTYPVSFDEAGLPATDGWYVNITGQPSLVATGAMSSLPTELANGTYTVRISTDDKTYAPSFTPTLQVNGAPVSTRIEFTLVTYTVTFRQTGLAAGTSWNVTVDGVSRSSVTPAIVFVEPNGSYRFTVGKVPGYSFSPTNGWMNVSGGNATASVTFSRSPAGSTFLGLSVTEGYLLVGGVLAVGVALGLVWGWSRRRRTSTFDPGQGSRPDRAPPGPG